MEHYLMSMIDSYDNWLNLRQPKLTVFSRYKGHHHTDYRLRSAFSNDDAYVLSGSEDNKMYIWDLLEVYIHSLFRHFRHFTNLQI
jgi:mitogen-activated protein kinase organizer 1